MLKTFRRVQYTVLYPPALYRTRGDASTPTGRNTQPNTPGRNGGSLSVSRFILQFASYSPRHYLSKQQLHTTQRHKLSKSAPQTNGQ